MNARTAVPVLTLLVVTVLLASCSDSNRHAPASASTVAGLTVPGTSPIPWDWDGGASTWDRNNVDLMVADAWSGCSFVDDDTVIDASLFTDAYLNRLAIAMNGALNPGCADTQGGDWNEMGLLERWYYTRTTPACNRDASTGFPAAATIEKTSIPLTIELSGALALRWRRPRPYAERDLRLPTVQHCIAMRLRALAPGAMGAQALLLSSEEQRQLQSEVKTRSQLAAVGYVHLLSVFSAPQATGLPWLLRRDQRIPLLQWWSRQTSNEEQLSGMITDFAAAVQLYITASDELSELLARSASARLSRGGDVSGVADEEWGPGSWRDRALASLYGGDPLVEEPPGSPATPWEHPFGKFTPGWADLGSSVQGNYEALPWPERRELPYVETELGGPKPAFFLGLAREADALLLELNEDAISGCFVVDRDAAKRWMMRAVEADLRTKTCAECLATGPGPEPGTEICLQCKQFGVEDVPDSELADAENLVVWQRHRITLDDAAKTVSLLSDFVEPVCATPNSPDTRPGARVVEGDLTWEYPGGVGTDPWLRISKDAVFGEPSWLERITPFTKLAPWRMPQPYSVLPAQPASQQGFSPISGTAAASPSEEAKRVLGSVSALAAIREAVIATDQRLSAYPHPVLGDRLQDGDGIVNLIGAAIGQGTMSVRPTVVADGSDVVVGTDVTGAPQWEVSILVPIDDPFWSDAAPIYQLGVVKNDPWAQRIIQNPNGSAFGKTIDTVAAAAIWFSFTPPSLWPASNPVAKRWVAYVSLPSEDVAWWTFVIKKSPPEDPLPTYGLLAGSMRVWGSEWSHGQYLAIGGKLGLAAMRTMTARDDEPSKPKYDGFGLPTTWSPPADPSLFGATGSTSTVEHYLARARVAADEATEAVSGAVESMLEQQSSTAEAAAAAAMSERVAEEEIKSMCGAAPSCEVSVVNWTPSINVPSLDCSGNLLAKEKLECHVQEILAPVAEGVPLAGQVHDRINEPAVPAFDEFAGGSLQSAFIEQWTAARQVQQLVDDLNVALVNAKHVVDLVQAEISAYGELVDLNCGSDAEADAIRAGKSCSWVPTSETVCVGPVCKTSKGERQVCSQSDGPLIAQQLKCDELQSQLPSLLRDNIVQQGAAMHDLVGFSASILEAQSRVRKSMALIQQVVLQAQINTEHAALESRLTAATRTTSFGLYRAYHSYDAWRAKALLENARRYSVAARRAIEARYVVDLSSLHADEPFVAAPATWADQVYTYDLSLPSAVGLAVTADGQDSGGVYPNVVKDYVGNLERFVEGFAIQRPTSASFEDRDVFTLPGLLWQPCDPFNEACVGGAPVDPASFAWSFYCPESGDWVPLPESGDASTACGEASGPTQARILFSLDPWGRLGMDIAHEPFAKRYNARWTRLAANLVGTGLQDCKNAEDPMTCYSQPFIRYNLTHLGPAWVTNDQGHWKALSFDPGWIEGAKALATEMWLDPISDGWSTPEIEAVMRGELRDRPLGGTYQLVLEVPPELDLSRLEMVQIMMGTEYWVKQQ